MTTSRHAAVALLIAGALASVTACDRQVPAHPDAEVAVDIFSGRQDPVVPLDEATVEALVTYLDSKASDAFATLGGTQQLGFDGLVVTMEPDTETLSTIRVLPHSVYVTDAVGTVRISDYSGTAFALVWDAVKPQLEADVVDAVEEEL